MKPLMVVILAKAVIQKKLDAPIKSEHDILPKQ
jgi:hypothetical protein